MLSAPVLAQNDSPFQSMGTDEQVERAPAAAPTPQVTPAQEAPPAENAPASPFRSMAGSEPAPQPQPLEAEAPEPVETPDQSSSPFLSMEAGTTAPQAAPTAAEPEMETTPEPEPALESAPSAGMEEPPTEPEPKSDAEGDAAAAEPDVPGDEDSGWSIGGFLGSVFGPSTDSAAGDETDQAMDAPAIEPTADTETQPAPAPLNVSSDLMQPNMRLSDGTSGENALLSRVNSPRTHIGGWEIPDKKAYPAPAQNNTMEEMRRAMQMRSN